MAKEMYKGLASRGIDATTNQSFSATATDLDILASLLASGRITRKDYAAYRKLRNKKTSAATGHNILFKTQDSRVASNSVSEVLNTTELLEQILSNLNGGLLITRAQLVCSGFKRVIDTSPTLQKALSSAIHMTNHKPFDLNYRSIHLAHLQYELLFDGLAKTFTWNLAPKSMTLDYQITERMVFKFDFTPPNLPFSYHISNKSFRQLKVLEKMPQKIDVLFYGGANPSGLSSQMLWLEAREGQGITFGEILDKVKDESREGVKIGGLTLVVYRP